VDSSEVYQPLRRDAWALAGFVIGLLATASVATSWLWRQRQRDLLHDRLAAELEQKRTAARFGMVMQGAKDIILMLDDQLRIDDANQQAVDTYGWTREELVTMSARDLRTAEAAGGFADAAARTRIADGATYETVHRRKDGSTLPVEVSSRRVEIDGRTQWLSIIRDISERKRAEVALRASEERYRLIAENTSDVIWLYDQSAEAFTYASPAALPLLGYRPEEIVGCKLLAFVAPESHDHARRTIERAIRSASDTRAPVHLAVELMQQRKDGSLVPTEVVTSVLLDSAGRVAHVLGVTRDITERKKAQETLEKFNSELEQKVDARTAELAARNREIEALIESIPDTVLLCDDRGKVITSHFPQSRATTFPFADHAAGQSLPGYHPAVLEIAQEMHAVAWASRQTVVLEFDRTINGTGVSIEARATPAGDEHLLVLLRDISSRKRLERGVLANLEREKQLSEMKSQFVSVASHEFRTPLAAAVGSLELLQRHAAKLTEAKRGELLTRIQRSLARLTAIMDEVLQLSRADSGRVKVKRMAVDLVQFVQDIIRDVELGDRQQHGFAFQASGGPNIVPVDTNLVNHILSNLLGNAVRYSPAGTKVAVRLEIDADAFSFTVADEGIGVPEAERGRIFEPFVRGSNVGQIAGTGLGLNIVKRYAELMGGHIELLPTERGATFRVTIPLSQSAA
jgi:PAS domain S-box-containing protein